MKALCVTLGSDSIIETLPVEPGVRCVRVKTLSVLATSTSTFDASMAVSSNVANCVPVLEATVVAPPICTATFVVVETPVVPSKNSNDPDIPFASKIVTMLLSASNPVDAAVCPIVRVVVA